MISIQRYKIIGTMIITIILCYCTPLCAQVSKKIDITGKVDVLNPDSLKRNNKVWLYQGMGKARKLVDSVQVGDDGKFNLRVMSPVSGLYQLDIIKCQTAIFWSDGDVGIIAHGFDTVRTKIKRSFFVQVESKSENTRLISTALYQKHLAEQENSLLSKELITARNYAKRDTVWYTYLRSNGLIAEKAQFEILRLKQLITANADKPAVGFLLNLLPLAEKELGFYSAELSKLSVKYPLSAEARQLQEELQNNIMIKKALIKGQVIPHLTYKDSQGKIIDINGFKGKYVLIDFWASWCIPCRQAIPELKKLYAQYKADGFEVLSISVDFKNAAWEKAVTEENMPWIQVLSPDPKKTMADFMITAIPTLYLVDREGKIVDRYTGYSVKLKDQLQKIFRTKQTIEQIKSN